MKLNKSKTSRLLLISLLFLSFSVISNEKKIESDNRTVLKLSQTETANFLREMRQMLTSIQGIIAGIASNDREKIIKSARYSGNRMARATPESITKKLPQSFKEIGGPTHMMFEELVIRAETDDMESLTGFTGELLQQCLTCHELYKVTTIEKID